VVVNRVARDAIMPICPKCGSPPVNAQVPSTSNISEKKNNQVTNLSIGAMIGVGAALLLVGLFIAFSLNGLYTQQTNYFASRNIQVSNYASGLDNIITLISFGALLAMIGVYALILGCLSQLSSKARIALAMKDGNARIGNGLLNAGFLMASLFSANLIQQHYKSISSSWYGTALIIFIISGLVTITIGSFFIRRSYLTVAYQQKFKEQTTGLNHNSVKQS
jgi:hypothetical protein